MINIFGEFEIFSLQARSVTARFPGIAEIRAVIDAPTTFEISQSRLIINH